MLGHFGSDLRPDTPIRWSCVTPRLYAVDAAKVYDREPLISCPEPMWELDRGHLCDAPGSDPCSPAQRTPAIASSEASKLE